MSEKTLAKISALFNKKKEEGTLTDNNNTTTNKFN